MLQILVLKIQKQNVLKNNPHPKERLIENAQKDGDCKESNKSFIMGFCKQWLIYHSSQMVKLGYSFLSELLFMFYFSFYLRNCLLYRWNGYDWATIVIIIVMMFRKCRKGELPAPIWLI